MCIRDRPWISSYFGLRAGRRLPLIGSGFPAGADRLVLYASLRLTECFWTITRLGEGGSLLHHADGSSVRDLSPVCRPDACAGDCVSKRGRRSPAPGLHGHARGRATTPTPTATTNDRRGKGIG